ncbi:MAG: undecaprenyl/decaprenyl-phosphate alpha-N-acetylglucosaminyl 1-phosphate transferase [Ruminococcaceae bacterium]|nr:undecaprenyl/decaprenyl-phosphate alpha-N-acetylglucosaminyl 1-phosphate transferase [Oscillospiraceae bacterium]
MKHILVALSAFLISAVITPAMMRIAPRIGAIDIPCDGRRLHKRPIPRTGGIAMFVAFLLGIGLIGGPREATVRLLLGATLLVLLGLIDDVYRLSAGVKIVFQALAALIALGGGAGISALSLWGATIDPGVWRLPLSMLWLVTLTNAHNMIDGLDGLCAGVSAIEAAMLALLLLLQGSGTWAGVSLVLCGAALGFLKYNRHPARIFMGDAGSQLLGFVLGYLSLRLDQPRAGDLGAIVPLLLFGVPLSDLTFAVVRRLLRGQSPFAADRGHWHHRLFDAGCSQRRTCRILTLVSVLLGGAALGVSRAAWYGYAVYALLWIVVVMMGVRVRYARRREVLRKNASA